MIKKNRFPFQPNESDSSVNHPTLPPIVLLHGWGIDSRVWQSLIPTLQYSTHVCTIDISYTEDSIDHLCAAIAEEISEPVILVGWSLGGMLATEVSARYPDKVFALVTLASNVQFVANNQWPYAMSANTYYPFYNDVESNHEKTIKHFMNLVALGDEHAKLQRKYLHVLLDDQSAEEKNNSVDKEFWLNGLKLLNSLNTQQVIKNITCPALHIYGDKDNVVPVDVAKNIQELNTTHQVATLSGAGHLLMLPEQRLLDVLQPFFDRVAL